MVNFNHYPHEVVTRGSPDTVSERETNERTDSANTVATLATLNFEDDFQLHGLEFTYDANLTEFDGTGGATSGSFDIDIMLTTRSQIPNEWAQASGVYYATRVGIVNVVTFEDDGAGTGGGAGGHPVSISGALDPRKMRRDVPQELNGGQAIRMLTENLSDWTGFDDAFEHCHLKAVGEVMD